MFWGFLEAHKQFWSIKKLPTFRVRAVGNSEARVVSMTSQPLKKVCSEFKNCKEEKEMKGFFLSLESSLGAAQKAAEELLQSGTLPKDIPLQSLLTIFGLVGNHVNHELQNYRDPMNIGINEGLMDFTPSISCNLSQNSLWYFSGSPQNESLVRHTRFQSKVTAVVLIKSGKPSTRLPIWASLWCPHS